SYLALLVPGGGYRLIAALGLTAKQSGATLTFDSGLTVQANILSVRPLDSDAGRASLLTTPQPPSDPFGFQGIYFLRLAGRVCLPWQFALSLTRGFLDGPPAQTERFSYRPSLCLDAKPNDDLRTIRIDPKPIALQAGQEIVVRAIAQPVNRDGVPTG